MSYHYPLTPFINVLGRRQDPDAACAAVISKWVSSLLAGEDVYINGDGETSRDFTYIDNTEAFNVAAGGRNTLNELYKIINDNLVEQFKINNCPTEMPLGAKLKIEKNPIYRDFRAGDIRHSNANISKAQNFVGYAPIYDIYQGMGEAIE